MADTLEEALKTWRLHFAFVVLTVVMSLAPNANAGQNKQPSEPCFTGTEQQLSNTAEEIYQESAAKSNGTLPSVIWEIGKHVVSRGCLFDARYASAVQVSQDPAFIKDAIANHTVKITFSNRAPTWLKPGFEAVIGGDDDPISAIVIETTNNGFVFHNCERDQVTGVIPPPTVDCPTLMSAAIFTPVDEYLARTNGAAHTLLVVLKSLANVSLLVTSNMGVGGASIAAQSLLNIYSPDSVATLQLTYGVRRSTSDVLLMGELAANNPHSTDSQLVTRLLPYKYADLKIALVTVLGKLFAHDYAKIEHLNTNSLNPNDAADPAMVIEEDYNEKIRAARLKAKSTVPQQAAPTEAAAPNAAPK